MNYYKFYAIIRDKFDLFLERRLIVSLQQFERKSLQEINQSIDVTKGIPFWKTLLLFSGPGSLVAVGYMDPGNWITVSSEGPIPLPPLISGSSLVFNRHAVATNGW